MNKCSICGREYEYNKNKRQGHTKTKCNSCLVNERRFKLRDFLKEYKKQGCSICGYNKNTAALHFHHKSENTKEFAISGNHSRSLKNIKKEIDKCIIVCSNCHHEIHNSEQNI